MAVIEEQGRQLSDVDIVAFENLIGSVLPEPYRRFLLKNNGGRPTPDRIYVEGLPGSPTDIQEFMGIDLPLKTSNLTWSHESTKSRIPDRLLPVARDSGGCVFCISLSGDDRGRVLYCDLTFDENDGTIYFTARDFDDFLERIISRELAN